MAAGKKEQRIKLFKRAKGRCHYCDVDMKLKGAVNDPRLMTIDHVVPRSDLWRFKNNYLPDNHVAACWTCNNEKKNMSYHEYIKYRANKLAAQ